MRKLVSSGSPYEPKLGISRAVRVGPHVSVAGTAPLGCGDPAAQARRCLEIIAAALESAGASLRDVVRTPANTIVQVSRFIDPEWLIEIEADAVVDA